MLTKLFRKLIAADQIDELEARLRETASENERLKSKIHALNDQNDRLHEDIKGHISTEMNHALELRSHELAIAYLNEILRKERNDNGEWRLSYSDMCVAYDHVSCMLQEKSETLDEVVRVRELLSQKLTYAESDVEAISEKCDSLKREIATTNADVDKAKARARRAEEDRDSLRDAIGLMFDAADDARGILESAPSTAKKSRDPYSFDSGEPPEKSDWKRGEYDGTKGWFIDSKDYDADTYFISEGTARLFPHTNITPITVDGKPSPTENTQ